jgi:hypothetical protein
MICVAFLILYVDGILLIENQLLEPIKESLEKSFSIKDLNETYYIHESGLSQSAYLDKVLNKFNMELAKKGFLPMSNGFDSICSICWENWAHWLTY